jgi:catechol 2,3-dioxygenase-like lactoylglutathione lyase family enzyme
MITRLSHTTIYVDDQDAALRFYTETLGFEVRTDVKMDNGFRWTTIGLAGQPDLEIVLMEPRAGGMFDQATADQLRALVRRGALGAGVMQVDDCRRTYDELKAKGVEFLAPPEDKFYGVEALLKDNSGNWFSMTQPHPQMREPNTKDVASPTV